MVQPQSKRLLCGCFLCCRMDPIQRRSKPPPYGCIGNPNAVGEAISLLQKWADDIRPYDAATAISPDAVGEGLCALTCRPIVTRCEPSAHTLCAAVGEAISLLQDGG